MTFSEFTTLAAIPIAIFMAVTMMFVGAALATKKNRQEAIRFLKPKDLGSQLVEQATYTWSLYFKHFFGGSVLAKRQLITIPLYTLSVSIIFFAVWIGYLYIFHNPTNSLSAKLPLHMKQGISDFYTKGIIAAIIIDTITIQLTKYAIRVGGRLGHGSWQFLMIFIGTLLLAYFAFSFAVYIFRIDDMIRLYTDLAPNDPMPVIPYTPLKNIADSLSLFQPHTLIHVTSTGLYTTYFMPEPLIFYCAVAGQMTLLFIVISAFIAGSIRKAKNLTIGVLNTVGTPKAGAYSMIMLAWLFLLSLVAFIVLIIVYFTG